jgi:hypothetical protein
MTRVLNVYDKPTDAQIIDLQKELENEHNRKQSQQATPEGESFGSGKGADPGSGI